jgi:hypothetical protein
MGARCLLSLFTAINSLRGVGKPNPFKNSHEDLHLRFSAAIVQISPNLTKCLHPHSFRCAPA